MNASIQLADQPTRDDLRVLLERLVHAGEPEVRIVSKGSVLAVYGCIQRPEGLLDTLPVVLAMRAIALNDAPEQPIDVTVLARSFLDRIARMGILGLDLDIPDSVVTAAWAGVLPPMGGWESHGIVDARSLEAVAREGIRRIADALPDQPGEAVVRSVRRQVWGAEIAPQLPASAAFAAEVLGFLKDESEAQLTRTRTWSRLSTGRGHVMVRDTHSLVG